MNLKTIAIASAVGSLLAFSSVTASAGDEWKYVPKGECEKMGGKVVAGEKKAM
jgi:uncharacterized membrane protein